MTDHNDVCPDCGADVSPVTASLKKALDTEREAAKKAQRQLKQAKEANKGIGDQSKKIAELEQALDAMKEQRTADAEELRKAQQAQIDAQQEIEPLRKENAALKDEAETGALTTLMTKNKMQATIMMPHAKKLRADNPDIKDDELVAELKKLTGADDFMKATDMSGGGSHSEGSSGGVHHAAPTKALRRSEMTERQAVDFQKEHGLDALLDLPR